MAKCLSHNMSVIRGSVGGLTYTANQYATIVMKRRVPPTNPNTLFQSAVRAVMSDVNFRWSNNLSQSDRDNWGLYATNTPLSGPVGEYKISGRLFYIAGRSLAQYLVNRFALTGVLTDDAPTQPGLLGISNFDVISAIGPDTGISVQFTNSSSDGVGYLINVSAPYNASRKIAHGPWDSNLTVADEIAGSGSVNHNIPSLSVGKRYFIRLRVVQLDTVGKPHIISAPFYGSALAT